MLPLHGFCVRLPLRSYTSSLLSKKNSYESSPTRRRDEAIWYHSITLKLAIMVARKARPSKLLNLKTSPEEQKVMYVSRTSHLSLNTDQYTQTIDTAKPSTPRHLRYSVYRQNCVAVSTIISSPASPSTFAQQRTGMAARDANTSSTCAKLPTTTKRHLYATSSAAVLISNGTFQDVRSTSHTTRQSTLWPSVLGF